MSELQDQISAAEPWAGFDLGVDVSEIARGGPDTDVAIGAYTVAAMQQAWNALPSDIRAEAQSMLGELGGQVVALIAEKIGTEIAEAIADGITEGISETPIVGQILQAVNIVVGVGSFVNDSSAQTGNRNRALARSFMFRGGPTPMYYRTVPVEGFAAWRGPGQPRWRWAACMPPDRGEADFWFGRDVPKVQGRWRVSDGVDLSCPIVQSEPWKAYGGCERSSGTEDLTPFSKAYEFVNALAFPYFTPSYPSRPMQLHYYDEKLDTVGPDNMEGKYIDPNATLVLSQMLAFMSANQNFRVHAPTLTNRTQHLRSVWAAKLEHGHLVGAIADPSGAKRAGAGSVLWTPDLVKNPAHLPTEDGRRFYIGDDGLIHVYQGYEHEQLDLGGYGFNPVVSGEDTLYACSLADYNAIVASTRAFMTARVAFLQNHRMCAALVADEYDETYGEEMAMAVRESAEMFNPGLVGGGGFDDPRIGAKTRARKPRRRGGPIGSGSDDGGGALLGFGIAAAALAALSRRRRR